MPKVFRAIIQWLVVTILLFFLVQIWLNLYDIQWVYKGFFLENSWYTTIVIASVFLFFVFFPYNTTIKRTLVTVIVLLNAVLWISFFSWLQWDIFIYRSVILVICIIIQMVIWQRKNSFRYIPLVINILCILTVMSILLLPNYSQKPTLSTFYTWQPNILHVFLADAPIILEEAKPILFYKIWSKETAVPISLQEAFSPISFTQDAIITLSSNQKLQNTYAVLQMYDGDLYPIPTQAWIELETLWSSGYTITYINTTGDVTVSLATQEFMEKLAQQHEQLFKKYVTDTLWWQRVLHPLVDTTIHIALQVAYTIFPKKYFENIQNYYSTQILLETLGMKESTDIVTNLNIELPNTNQFQESIKQTFLYKRLFIQE